MPLVQMREVQVSLAGGDQASPFLQVVQTRLVVLAVPMVVQPFLEPAVLSLGAAVPGLFQMVALPVLYLLEDGKNSPIIKKNENHDLQIKL